MDKISKYFLISTPSLRKFIVTIHNLAKPYFDLHVFDDQLHLFIELNLSLISNESSLSEEVPVI